MDSSSAADVVFTEWCRKDFSTSNLQTSHLAYDAHSTTNAPRQAHNPESSTPNKQQPPTTSTTSPPLSTEHAEATHEDAVPEQGSYKLPRRHTDHISDYAPPPGTRPREICPSRFDALSQSKGWEPKSANVPGSNRAVYDPVSHTTKLYTYGGSSAGITCEQGKGDELLRRAIQEDNQKERWYGRRKGVVEFVDKTATFAVNQNDEFVQNANAHPRFAARITGDMTNWFDNAFLSGSKVPFRNN